MKRSKNVPPRTPALLLFAAEQALGLVDGDTQGPLYDWLMQAAALEGLALLEHFRGNRWEAARCIENARRAAQIAHSPWIPDPRALWSERDYLDFLYDRALVTVGYFRSSQSQMAVDLDPEYAATGARLSGAA